MVPADDRSRVHLVVDPSLTAAPADQRIHGLFEHAVRLSDQAFLSAGGPLSHDTPTQNGHAPPPPEPDAQRLRQFVTRVGRMTNGPALDRSSTDHLRSLVTTKAGATVPVQFSPVPPPVAYDSAVLSQLAYYAGLVGVVPSAPPPPPPLAAHPGVSSSSSSAPPLPVTASSSAAAPAGPLFNFVLAAPATGEWYRLRENPFLRPKKYFRRNLISLNDTERLISWMRSNGFSPQTMEELAENGQTPETTTFVYQYVAETVGQEIRLATIFREALSKKMLLEQRKCNQLIQRARSFLKTCTDPQEAKLILAGRLEETPAIKYNPLRSGQKSKQRDDDEPLELVDGHLTDYTPLPEPGFLSPEWPVLGNAGPPGNTVTAPTAAQDTAAAGSSTAPSQAEQPSASASSSSATFTPVAADSAERVPIDSNSSMAPAAGSQLQPSLSPPPPPMPSFRLSDAVLMRPTASNDVEGDESSRWLITEDYSSLPRRCNLWSRGGEFLVKDLRGLEDEFPMDLIEAVWAEPAAKRRRQEMKRVEAYFE